MVQYHRNNYPLKKGSDSVQVIVDKDDQAQRGFGIFGCGTGSASGCGTRTTTKSKLLYMLYLCCVSCALILAPQFITSPFIFSRLYSSGVDDEPSTAQLHISPSLCSSVPNGTVCCDRSGFRSDICIMKGDVRTNSSSFSIFVYNSSQHTRGIIGDVNAEQNDIIEKIRPYTRKWETSVMNTISELNVIRMIRSSGRRCDITHDVPAVFFSTGGYTGNVYHEFNDGIIPLYITSQHLNKKVVFVILEYHDWWITKYGDILSHLSDYPPIDFGKDERTHCFPEAIIGLRIHNELAVDPSLTEGHKSIKDFRDLLDRSYWPRISGLIQDEEREDATKSKAEEPSPTPSSEDQSIRPRLVILSRNGSRAIINEAALVRLAEEIGFEVEVLRPDRTTELAKIYRALNSSEVMVGVHGAAMTHFMFMRPGRVFIQVVPLGTEWAAETYYGEPAMKLGLEYIAYKITAEESSLYDEYGKDDPVLRDPNSVTKKGWEFTKKVYLDRQMVRINLRRFSKRLSRAYYYLVSRNGTASTPLMGLQSS